MRRIKTITRPAPPTIRSAPAASVGIDGLGAMKRALATIDAEVPCLTFGELTVQVGTASSTTAPQGVSPTVEARPEAPSQCQETGFLTWRDSRFEVEVVTDTDNQQGGDK